MTEFNKEQPRQQSLVPKRILLVDDEPDITTALKVGLEMKGFSVDAFNDPVAALASFARGAYQIAVLDIRMPGMSGFELCREIAKEDAEVKIVFLTAFEVNYGEFTRLFPNTKAHDILKKPMSIGALASRLEEL